MRDLSHVISLSSYRRLELLWRNRALPPRWSRAALEIWTEGRGSAVRDADDANVLLPLLTSYAPMLNKAADLAGENPHLAEKSYSSSRAYRCGFRDRGWPR